MSTASSDLIARFAALRVRGAVWWHGLNAREQLFVVVLGAAAVALLLSAIILPMLGARREAMNAIRLHESLQSGLVRPGAGSVSPQRVGDAVAILSGSATQFALAPVQLSPQGRGAQAEIADARFEDLIRWISEIERTSDLRVAFIDVRRGGASGRVSVSASFVR